MISCDQHDYIEIVCTFRYPIRLTLKSGSVLHGVGLDTGRDSDKRECIEIDLDGEKKLVDLDDIALLEVCVDNPHFQRLCFDDPPGRGA